MHCKALDGLRGYAAMSVIIFHALIYYNMNLWELYCSTLVTEQYTTSTLLPFSLAITLFNGRTPVNIFFILSGYVISASIMKSDNSYISFLIKRIGRIYPAVIACILLTAIVAIAINKTTGLRPIFYPLYLKDALNNALLIGNEILGVTWTLTVEIVFAIIVYPLCLLIKKYGCKPLILAMIYAIVALEHPSLTLNIPSMNKSLIFFISGMLLNTKEASTLFKNMERYLPAVILSIFTLGRVFLEYSTNYLLTQAILCSLLIGILIYSNKGVIIRFLMNRFSSFVGKISYSLYLFAVPVWHVVSIILPYHGNHPIIFGVFAGVLTVLISMPLSMLTYKYIEQPSIESAKALSMHPIFSKTASYNS